MGENFLDRLQPRTATPTVAHAPVDRDATAYARAALAGEVDNLLAVPIGSGRNHQLNVSAMKMGQLVAAGAIDERTVTETLGAADGGLDYKATRDTIRSGLEAGKAQGRAIPEPTVTTHQEIPPWERSDDPFSPNYVAPRSASSPASSAPGPASSVTPSAASTTTTPSTPTTAADADGTTESTTTTDPAYAALVAAEAGQLRVRRDARRLIDHEDAARVFTPPDYLDTLTDELALPDEPVLYRVDKLIPAGGNVLLAAQFKAGKTTLVSNLIRGLADGEPFLGTFKIEPVDGTIVMFNYEVERAQYRAWLRDIGVENTDRVSVLNLRGLRLPLLVPHVEDWVVAYLKAREARVWIVDPFARAASGIDENSNTEVGTFLETLDVIKQRAGVTELILPTHTGRAEHEQGDERARGATRLDDWADVRWLLTKAKDDTRFFRATGRDVDTDESALAFDTDTRRLTLTGGDRYSVELAAYRDAVLSIVKSKPGVGTVDLRTAVKQIRRTSSNERVATAVESLSAARQMHTRRTGHAVGHFPGPNPDTDPFTPN